MNFTVKEVTQISILAAMSFISSFITIPFGPVPFTLQTLFVLLTGLVLAPKPACLAQIIHLMLKLLISGPQSILSPSFGFLFGFIAAAAVIAIIIGKSGYSLSGYINAVAWGTIVIYAIGLPYMAVVLNGYMGLDYSLTEILMAGFVLFIPGDFIKAIIAVAAAKRLNKSMKTADSN